MKSLFKRLFLRLGLKNLNLKEIDHWGEEWDNLENSNGMMDQEKATIYNLLGRLRKL